MSSYGLFRFAVPLAFVAMGLILCPAAARADSVTVTLKSGRTLTGELDQRTTDEQLVLRFEGPSSRLWRPIAWDQIVSAQHDQQELTIDQLRELAGRSATVAVPLSSPQVVPLTDDRPADRILPRVVALQIEAALANWDADVEPDGVGVEAWPLDANGNSVAVDGTLQVELIAARPRAIYGRYVQTRGEPFPQLAYMSFVVHRQDMRNGPARFQLPFQWRDPQFDLSVASMGIVHARLAVPGQGVFEASADLVRIRSQSPTRDDLQQLTGRWYFPREWTAGGR